MLERKWWGKKQDSLFLNSIVMIPGVAQANSDHQNKVYNTKINSAVIVIALFDVGCSYLYNKRATALM